MKSDDLNYQKGKIKSLAAGGRWQEALSVCKRLLPTCNGDPELWFYFGHIMEQTDNPEKAVECYRQVISLMPGYAEAYNCLGVVYEKLGRLEEAEAAYRHSTGANKRFVAGYYNLGRSLRALGRSRDAVVSFAEAARLAPDVADILLELGGVRLELAEFDGALKSFQRVTQVQKSNANALIGAGKAQAGLGLIDEAEASFRSAVNIDSSSKSALLALGYFLVEKKDYAESKQIFHRAVDVDAEFTDGWQGLAYSALAMGDARYASECYQKVVSARPEDDEALAGLGYSSLCRGDADQAIKCYRQLIERYPKDAIAHYQLANAYELSGEYAEALALHQAAIELNSDLVEAVVGQASIYEKQAHYDKAIDLLLPLIEKSLSIPRLIELFGKLCKRFSRCEEAIDLALKGLSKSELAVADRMIIEFSLGTMYEDVGSHDSAFECFRRANSLKYSNFDIRQFQDYISSITDNYSPELFENHLALDTAPKKLIFIVGMPRSGTSLVEQILSAHPSVFGAGEQIAMIRMSEQLCELVGLDDKYPCCVKRLQRADILSLREHYLSQLPRESMIADCVVDKMPHNFLNVGLIRLLFPEAVIIHCHRGALDTCLSIYCRDFGGSHPYSYSLDNLGMYYLEYLRLMRHWQYELGIPMLHIQYENLVRNLNAESRQLLDYCNLSWDEQCKNFYVSKRVVTTSSYDQVRQPIYQSSIGKWRSYKKYLGSLIDTLGVEENSMFRADPGKM